MPNAGRIVCERLAPPATRRFYGAPPRQRSASSAAAILPMFDRLAQQRADIDDEFPLGDEGEYVLPTKQQAAAGLGRIVVRGPALGSAYMRLTLALRRWRLEVTGTRSF